MYNLQSQREGYRAALIRLLSVPREDGGRGDFVLCDEVVCWTIPLKEKGRIFTMGHNPHPLLSASRMQNCDIIVHTINFISFFK